MASAFGARGSTLIMFTGAAEAGRFSAKNERAVIAAFLGKAV